MPTFGDTPDDRRRRRAGQSGRAAMVDIACARIGMLLEAPRAACRDSSGASEPPSVVEALLRAAAKSTPRGN